MIKKFLTMINLIFESSNPAKKKEGTTYWRGLLISEMVNVHFLNDFAY